MNSEQISLFGGILISLSVAYIPGLKQWFDARSGVEKRSVLALAMILVSGGAVVLGCYDIVAAVSCDKPGIVALVTSLANALIASQATYKFAVEK